MTQTLYICINKKGGPACIGEQSRAVFRALRRRVKERTLDIKVERLTCMGDCAIGPNVKIHGGRVFHSVGVDDVDGILNEMLGSAS